MNGKTINYFAWGVTGAVTVSAILVWGQMLNWQIIGTSSYQLFPLFGLLAFSFMWSHYIVYVARQLAGVAKEKIITYIEATGFAVLLLIFLHPGLLIWQLWRDGFGLPPGSYLENYVAPTARLAVTIGTVAFFIFLAYELHRWFKDKKWWPYVARLSDLAMLGIFYHGLSLGTHLQSGWYMYVWWFYGITLVLAISYIYWQMLAPKLKAEPSA